MRRQVFLFVTLLALVATPPALLAQLTTGSITGTVSDETGAVLPGVAVTITGATIAAAQTFVTGPLGSYRFSTLPPGQYDVTFVMDGFATLSHQQIVVSVGGVVELNVTLRLSEVAETVTVIGETPVVDTRSTHLDTTYDRDWVENAPTRRFVFFDYLNAAPGISQNSYTSSRSSVMGSGTDENTYQLDGTDITSDYNGVSWPWPNIDAIEEVEILSLGAPAEYGNATGAVFNIVTRQGTNAFHGDANIYIQTDGLTDSNTTEEEDDGFPFHRDEFVDVTGQVGGPILKDRLWFFAGYQYQKDASSQPGTDPDFPTLTENKRFIGKLNYQINDTNKIVFMFHNDTYFLPLTRTATEAPSTIRVETGKAPTVNLAYTNILSQSTLLEGRFSGFWSDDHGGPLEEGQPRVLPRFYNVDTGEITGGTYYWYDSDVFKTAFNAKLTHYAEDFLGGSHDFKFGVQWHRGGVNGNLGYNDFIYLYEYQYDDGTSYTYAYYGYVYETYSYSGVSTNLGVWIDDSWQVNDRLTLNLGVRYDNRRASVEEVATVDENGNPIGGSTIPNDNVYTWNPVSPRLGFNLKLTEDGRTILKGHYGRYYRKIITCEYCTNIGASPHALLFGIYDLEAQDFLFLEPFEFIPGNRAINPNYKNPYTDQFIVGFERELAPTLGLQLNYAYKRGRDYSAWQDIAGVYEDAVYIDDQGVDATGDAITVQRLLSEPADRFFEITNDDRMNTRIHAFTVQVVKRMTGNWQLNSSLSYVNTDGLLASGRDSPIDSQTTSLVFADFGQNPNDFVNARGRLIGERQWMFKTQLLYQFPLDFLVAVNYIGQSGNPWAREARVDGLGLITEIQVEERDGSRRIEAWNLLDVRVQKMFLLGPQARIGLFLDALNLFNEGTNEDILSRLGTSESFGVPSNFLPPRRLMIGAKFQF